MCERSSNLILNLISKVKRKLVTRRQLKNVPVLWPSIYNKITWHIRFFRHAILSSVSYDVNFRKLNKNCRNSTLKAQLQSVKIFVF